MSSCSMAEAAEGAEVRWSAPEGEPRQPEGLAGDRQAGEAQATKSAKRTTFTLPRSSKEIPSFFKTVFQPPDFHRKSGKWTSEPSSDISIQIPWSGPLASSPEIRASVSPAAMCRNSSLWLKSGPAKFANG